MVPTSPGWPLVVDAASLAGGPVLSDWSDKASQISYYPSNDSRSCFHLEFVPKTRRPWLITYSPQRLVTKIMCMKNGPKILHLWPIKTRHPPVLRRSTLACLYPRPTRPSYFANAEKECRRNVELAPHDVPYAVARPEAGYDRAVTAWITLSLSALRGRTV